MIPEEDPITRSADDSNSGRNDADDSNFSVGTVVRVEGDTFAILEYDFPTDIFVEQSFQVDSATEYGNFRRLADLRAGDSLALDYRFDENRRVASLVIKEVPEPDEDGDFPADQ